MQTCHELADNPLSVKLTFTASSVDLHIEEKNQSHVAVAPSNGELSLGPHVTN